MSVSRYVHPSVHPQNVKLQLTNLELGGVSAVSPSTKKFFRFQ